MKVEAAQGRVLEVKLSVVWPWAGLLLTGCASKPGTLPEERRVVKPVERKESAGKVTFRGLGSDELASIRVIPETGKEVFQPENRSYDQVDGFWWRGEAGHWFKIPDLSEAWVGEAPGKFDGRAHRGDLTVYQRSQSMMNVLGKFAGRMTVPAWVRDAGATRSPVKRDEAFREE